GAPFVEYYHLAICYFSHTFCYLVIDSQSGFITNGLDAYQVVFCDNALVISPKMPPNYYATSEKYHQKLFSVFQNVERDSYANPFLSYIFGYPKKFLQLDFRSNRVVRFGNTFDDRN